MNQRDYERNLSEAVLLLDQPPGCNGRWQRGIQIASVQSSVVQGTNGWRVRSQSSDREYHVTPQWCNCRDGKAPRYNDIKWCKHRVAVSIWNLAHKLGANLAAIKVSERERDGHWVSSHWTVADEGTNRTHDVYLKRIDTTGGGLVIEVICECGRLVCSQNRRTVCRHARRCIERLAEKYGKQLYWTWDLDAALRLKRMGGTLFQVVSNASGHECYGLARKELNGNL